MDMVSVRILRVGLRDERSSFNALVEFAGNIPEVGRSDFESLALANAITQLIGSVQILIAEGELAKITV